MGTSSLVAATDPEPVTQTDAIVEDSGSILDERENGKKKKKKRNKKKKKNTIGGDSVSEVSNDQSLMDESLN